MGSPVFWEGPLKRNARSLPIKESIIKSIRDYLLSLMVSCVLAAHSTYFPNKYPHGHHTYIEGQESTSPNQPTEFWVESLSVWIYLVVGKHCVPNVSGVFSLGFKVVILNKIDMLPADAWVERRGHVLEPQLAGETKKNNLTTVDG